MPYRQAVKVLRAAQASKKLNVGDVLLLFSALFESERRREKKDGSLRAGHLEAAATFEGLEEYGAGEG